MTRQNKAGAVLAMLTCPCHAVMLVFVLTGTTAGSWLAAQRAYLYLGFTLAFLLGLWLMVRRTAACADGTCDVPAQKPGDAAPQGERAAESGSAYSRPTSA
jgi:mercuric ion transport protein